MPRANTYFKAVWAALLVLCLAWGLGNRHRLQAESDPQSNWQTEATVEPVATNAAAAGVTDEEVTQLVQATRASVLNPPNSRPSAHAATGSIRLAAHTKQANLLQTLQPRMIQDGTSSRKAKKAARAKLPLQHLTPENRRRAEEVLRSVSLFRKLPTYSFEVEPDVYWFFVSHPDVAVSIWRSLGISKFQMWQTGPDTYEADAGDGSYGVVDVLYRGTTEHLIACDGVYKSPFLVRRIKARALMHLETRMTARPDGKADVQHCINLFVSFPSSTVKRAAKLVSPISNLIVDRNFREVTRFLQLMSRAMASQPGWVERIAGRMEGVHAMRRDQLLKLTARVFVAARKRQLAGKRPGHEISINDVMQPLHSPGIHRTASGDEPIGQIR
jgi:hypothetical protein